MTIAMAGDGSRVYVPHLGQLSPTYVPMGVTAIDPIANQVKTEIGGPFANPDCQTDISIPNMAVCAPGTVGGRMRPVFMVSQ